QSPLPPIRSGPSLGTRFPLWAIVPTCVALTNRRSVAPSYVAARWVHAFRVSGELATASTPVPLVTIQDAGCGSLSFAYNEYARSVVPSFMITVRQPLNAVGYTQASTVIPIVRS